VSIRGGETIKGCSFHLVPHFGECLRRCYYYELWVYVLRNLMEHLLFEVVAGLNLP
jgi:hypothetical protein